MVNITRLEHQQGGFTRIDSWAIEREALRRSREWNVRLDIVKRSWVVTEVLSLKEDDREIRRHGVACCRCSRLSPWRR